MAPAGGAVAGGRHLRPPRVQPAAELSSPPQSNRRGPTWCWLRLLRGAGGSLCCVQQRSTQMQRQRRATECAGSAGLRCRPCPSITYHYALSVRDADCVIRAADGQGQNRPVCQASSVVQFVKCIDIAMLGQKYILFCKSVSGMPVLAFTNGGVASVMYYQCSGGVPDHLGAYCELPRLHVLNLALALCAPAPRHEDTGVPRLCSPLRGLCL
jgi:hypothetical protein